MAPTRQAKVGGSAARREKEEGSPQTIMEEYPTGSGQKKHLWGSG